MDVENYLQSVCTEKSLSVKKPMSITTDRIKILAARAIEGVPALTVEERQQLTLAVLEHMERERRQDFDNGIR